MSSRTCLPGSAGLALTAALLGAAVTAAADEPREMRKAKKLTVTSTAFANGAAIPAQYTCDGQDAPPPLAWSPLPAKTKSVALICEDPDAPGGVWTHWVVYNLPPATTSFDPGQGLPEGAVTGQNSWGELAWGGPCPPPADGAHRYRFRVFALKKVLKPLAVPTRAKLLAAMKGKTLLSGTLTGTYDH